MVRAVRGRCVRGARLLAAFAALSAFPADPARAHEPFQITTDARVLADTVRLHVTMASRTATLACPGVVGAPRSLRAEDLERLHAPLVACAESLYAVSSRGRALVPASARISLTEEGDFDAWLVYPPAAPGPLVFDAVHLGRIADPLYGAELTVTGNGTFLGQMLLRAAAPSFTVAVPANASERAYGDTPRPPSRVPLLIGAVACLALVLVAGSFWLVRRRR
jgi:hypothetical protein